MWVCVLDAEIGNGRREERKCEVSHLQNEGTQKRKKKGEKRCAKVEEYSNESAVYLPLQRGRERQRERGRERERERTYLTEREREREGGSERKREREREREREITRQ